MLGKAIALASQMFENRKDKGGHPYILHCLRVMDGVGKDADEDLKIIAVMHDIIEDIFTNNPELGFRELSLVGFSDRVITALKLLTHDKSIPYEEYIKQLSFNQDARKVKLSDLRDNSDITRLKGLRKKDFERLEKYHKAYVYLSE